MKIDELKARARTLLEEAGQIAKSADDAGRDFTADERTAVKAKLDEAKDLKAQADAIAGDDDLRKALTEANAASVSDAPLGSGLAAAKSLGDLFVSDAEVKTFLERTKTRLSDGARVGESPAVGFRGIRDLDRFGRKDVVTGLSDTSAGALVNNDWRGLLDLGAFQRPLTIRDLVTVGQTTSDTVEYARVTGWTSGAAPVAEASGTAGGTTSGDVVGTKPQSSMSLEKVTATVKTVAHWIPATKRALSDAAQVRTLIDNFLRYGLDEELDDQMINGDDTGENFEGILEVDGTQPQAWDTDLLVTTRKARTKVKIGGRATPTAYVFNPADNERIDLLRDGVNGGFLLEGPPRWECKPSGVSLASNRRASPRAPASSATSGSRSSGTESRPASPSPTLTRTSSSVTWWRSSPSSGPPSASSGRRPSLPSTSPPSGELELKRHRPGGLTSGPVRVWHHPPMPSSALPLVPTVVIMALEHHPRVVLDVGPGNGKYGLLFREYGRTIKRLDAIEAEPRYLAAFPWLGELYDDVHLGGIEDRSGAWLEAYDLVLMADVLEHLDHGTGEALLRRIPGRVIVCTPVEFFQNPEADAGWPTERHRSVWTVAELEAIRPLEVIDQVALDVYGGVLVTMAPL